MSTQQAAALDSQMVGRVGQAASTVAMAKRMARALSLVLSLLRIRVVVVVALLVQQVRRALLVGLAESSSGT